MNVNFLVDDTHSKWSCIACTILIDRSVMAGNNTKSIFLLASTAEIHALREVGDELDEQSYRYLL